MSLSSNKVLLLAKFRYHLAWMFSLYLTIHFRRWGSVDRWGRKAGSGSLVPHFSAYYSPWYKLDSLWFFFFFTVSFLNKKDQIPRNKIELSFNPCLLICFLPSPPPARPVPCTATNMNLDIFFQFISLLSFFFFLATPAACRNSQATDRTHTTAVTRATAVTTLDP